MKSRDIDKQYSRRSGSRLHDFVLSSTRRCHRSQRTKILEGAFAVAGQENTTVSMQRLLNSMLKAKSISAS